MRIGIEAQRIFRSHKHGMEVVALELIRQIRKLDTTNEYIVFARDDADRSCLQERDRFMVKTPHSTNYATWEQLGLPRAVRKERVDFLHCTCNTAPLFCPVPLLVTIHDIIYLEHADFKGTAYQNFGNLYRRFIVPRIVDKARQIITVSESEKQVILKKFGLPPEKVTVIYNAVGEHFNDRYPDAQIQALRKKYGLPESFLFYMGNTAPQKNTPGVIRAFVDYCRQAKDPVPLVMLGYDRALVQHALEKAGNGKWMEKFIFPKYLPAGELPLMYQASTVFLYPSLREGFGLPILEAMGCGTPVITSGISSMPEVAGGCALLVDPLECREITQAICSLLSDEGLRQQLRKKGIERASQFSWENSARQLLAVYDQMVSH